MSDEPVIDIKMETLVSLKEGHKLGLQEAPTYRQMWRWVNDGVKIKTLPDRPVVRLESIVIGGAIYTSVEAFDRWTRKKNLLRQRGFDLRDQANESDATA